MTKDRYALIKAMLLTQLNDHELLRTFLSQTFTRGNVATVVDPKTYAKLQ